MTDQRPTTREVPDQTSMLQALQQMKSSMERVDRRLAEPLAIVGLGCRFPGSDGPDALWRRLSDGDRYEPNEGDRWDQSLQSAHEKQPGRITANGTSWLDSIDHFDAGFFGISGREASTMDPQQRLLLEVAWETLEHAGIDPHSQRGRRVGAFVGICSHDYLHRLTQRGLSKVDTYLSTGNSHGAAAGRLAYVMDWRGPAVAVDTACSSSLTAMHQAARALRYGDCDAAMALGVNVILAPELSVSLSQAGLLSPSRRCHTFGEQADGFVRGEGCGAVLMKRLSDAIDDGDEVLAIVRGSATNQDGRSNGLTAPNGVAQRDVIHAALADARLRPEEVGYIEAHGTGTKLGDPIEIDALKQVFAPERSADSPIRVGSIKTNLGHLEGAAGIAGVIKATLAISKGYLPAHLNCDQPSSQIDWDWPVSIQRQGEDWNVPQPGRVIGVSSFGFGGSNAHILLSGFEAARPSLANSDAGHPDHASSLFVLSAKSASALVALSTKMADALDGSPLRLADVCHTVAIGRACLSVRMALIADSIEDLVAQLRHYSEHREVLVPSSAPADLIRMRESYLDNGDIDWSGHWPRDVRRVHLPTYAFDRKRRWYQDGDCRWSPNVADATVSENEATADSVVESTRFDPHPLINERIDVAGASGDDSTTLYDGSVSATHDNGFWADHRVRGSILMPAAGLLDLIAAVAERESSDADSSLDIVDFELHRPVKLNPGQTIRLQVRVTQSGSDRSVTVWMCRSNEMTRRIRWHQAAACRLVPREGELNLAWTADLPSCWTDETSLPMHWQKTDAANHYQRLSDVGLQYGPAFQGVQVRHQSPIQDDAVGDHELAVGRTRLPGGLCTRGFAFHPAWLDACFQVAAELVNDASTAWIPVSVDACQIFGIADERAELVTAVSATAASEPDRMSLDFRVETTDGSVVAIISGLAVQRLAPIRRTPTVTESQSPANPESAPTELLQHTLSDDAIVVEPGTLDPCELRNRLHQRVAHILETSLADVPLDEPLDGLGLDSLMAFELRDEVDKMYGVEIPLEMFFQSVTLSSFLDTVVDRIMESCSADDRGLDTASTSRDANAGNWVEGAI
ncbi:MAG: beta-ketoacyl synthase N-terminal-like domain-containing protein [Planctomycetota bacterium]